MRGKARKCPRLSLSVAHFARTWGDPTTCTIVWKQGKWYASITVKCEVFRETGIGCVGIDFGTHHAVAMSDNCIIENPKFLAKAIEKIKIVSSNKKRKRTFSQSQFTLIR